MATLSSAPAVIRHRDVEIDVREGRVVRGGKDQHLRHKVFQVLLYLIEHRDRPVSREELMVNIWPDTAVTDDALVQCIVDLRKALGDDSRDSHFVRTIPKRGYRFIVPDEPEAGSSTIFEVENTTTMEVEIVEEPDPVPRARFSRSSLAIAALAVSVVALSAVTYRAVRAREQTQRRGLQPITPIDSLTANTQALQLYTLGVERAESYHLSDAIRLFEQAIALDPEFAMAHARIGYARSVVGAEKAAALPYFARALQFPDRLSEKDRMIIGAWKAIASADYTNAIDQYQLIVDRYPTDSESYHRLAHLLLGEERITEAVKVLEHARFVDPTNPNTHNTLGIYSYLGRHEESIEARKQYIALRPREPNAWDSLGLSYHHAGRYEEALDAYARALELRPGFDLGRYHRAATYVQLGRFRDAIRDIHECLHRAKSEEEVGRAWATLGDVYWMMGDLSRAADAVRRVPARTPWQPSLVHIDARLLREIDEQELVARNIRFGGRGARPERRFEFVFRGYLALRRGEHDEALDLFRRALQFRAPWWYVDTYDTILADALRELGRPGEAAREYERVLALHPRLARARYGLARAHDALGKRAEARAEYQRFLALWKDADRDNRDLIEARRRLAQLNAS